jgi:Carboxypeptidase regulatory-like domain
VCRFSPRTLALACVAPLLVACGASGGGAGPARSAVSGLVVAAPACPVESTASSCPPVPVDGAQIRLLRGGNVVSTGRTGADGTFALSVPAGSFVLRVTNSGGYRSEWSRSVTLTAEHTTTVRVVLDSGIR